MPNSTEWTNYIDKRFDEYYLGQALEQLANGGIDEWKESLDELERCKHCGKCNNYYDAGKHLCTAYKLAYGLEGNRWKNMLTEHLVSFLIYDGDMKIHINECLEQFWHHHYKEGWYSLEQAFKLYYHDNMKEDAHNHFGRQDDDLIETMRNITLGQGVFY